MLTCKISQNQEFAFSEKRQKLEISSPKIYMIIQKPAEKLVNIFDSLKSQNCFLISPKATILEIFSAQLAHSFDTNKHLLGRVA